MRTGGRTLGTLAIMLAGSCLGAALAQEAPAPVKVAGAPKATKASRKVELPAAVRTAFESAYPTAVIKHVSKEKDSGFLCYEIESMDSTQARDLVYRADGSVVEIEEAMAVADLPQPVQQAIASGYPNGKILKAEKLMRGGTVSYEIHLKAGGKKRELAFDATGAPVKKEPEKETATPPQKRP